MLVNILAHCEISLRRLGLLNTGLKRNCTPLLEGDAAACFPRVLHGGECQFGANVSSRWKFDNEGIPLGLQKKKTDSLKKTKGFLQEIRVPRGK